jgi:predicted nucleic acid-binding protein
MRILAAGLRYELVWTPAIAVECRRILDLPRIHRRLKGRETQARRVLARLATIATMVPPDLLGDVRVVESDPDDDVLFATALAAWARTIVSGDSAVLAVGSFPGVMVVSTAEFLATLGEA